MNIVINKKTWPTFRCQVFLLPVMLCKLTPPIKSNCAVGLAFSPIQFCGLGVRCLYSFALDRVGLDGNGLDALDRVGLDGNGLDALDRDALDRVGLDVQDRVGLDGWWCCHHQITGKQDRQKCNVFQFE